MTNHSYKRLIKKHPQNTPLAEARDVAHSAVVARIYQLPSGKVYAALVGGNENDSVEVTRVELENGLIKHPNELNIFGVVKLMECNK